MAFTIKAKTITELVGIAAKIVGKSTVKVAECIKISYGGKGLEVETTNFDTWMTLSTTDFKAKDATVAVVPCRALHAVIAAIPGEQDITLDVTAKSLVLKTESSKYNFGLSDPMEWPSLSAESKSHRIELKAGDLSEALKFVFKSIGRDSNHYYLNGVHFKAGSEKVLRVIATDGHRGSQTVIALDKSAALPAHGVIVPRDLVATFLDLLGRVEGKEEVALDISENRCRLAYSSAFRMSIVGKMIDGTFPDFDRVVPYTSEQGINVISKSKTIEAINRVSALAGNKRGIVLSFAAGKLKLYTRSDSGDAEEFVPLADGQFDGDTGANFTLLSEILSEFKKDEIAVMLDKNNPQTAPLLFVENGVDPSPETKGLCILMPMRV